MPSSELTSLCKKIEQQDTDHFGKFYMYVGLLQSVAVRKKSFTESIPKYNRFLRSDKPLNIGEIPTDFTAQLNQYTKQFQKIDPSWFNTIANIVLAYFHKGKISDLAYIVDQMLLHLDSIQGNPSKNAEIYNNLNFEQKKEGLIKFIEDISNFNHYILNIANIGINSGLAALTVLTGLTVILASVFSLVPSIIGLGMIIAGGCAAYYCITHLLEEIDQLERCLQQVNTVQLPVDTSLFTDNHTFFSTPVTVLPYAIITAMEQLAPNKELAKQAINMRSDLDDSCAKANI